MQDFNIRATYRSAGRTIIIVATGTTYTLVKLPDDATCVTSTFTCTLKFLVKDCDPNTGEADEEGYEDEYMVSDEEGYEDEYMVRTS